MEVSCELHVPVALPPREEFLVPTEHDSIRTFRRQYNLFLLVQWIEPTDHPVRGSHYSDWATPNYYRTKSKVNNRDKCGYYNEKKWHSYGATRKIGILRSALFWVSGNFLPTFIWYWYLIYLLTAIGLTPGGSSTVHIYTQTNTNTNNT